MAGNGDWFARGDLTDDSDWVVRNGELVAVASRRESVARVFAEAAGAISTSERCHVTIFLS